MFVSKYIYLQIDAEEIFIKMETNEGTKQY